MEDKDFKPNARHISLVEKLLEKDPNSTGYVTSVDFEQAFRESGFDFGTAESDRIMVNCRIVDDGRVGYQNFATLCGAPPADEVLGPRPTQREQSLTRHLSRRSLNIEELRENVNKHLPEISRLFVQLDNNHISTAGFRHALYTLGIQETPDALALLKKGEETGELKFSRFIAALSMPDERHTTARAGGGTPLRTPGILTPTRLTKPRERIAVEEAIDADITRDSDILLWRTPEKREKPHGKARPDRPHETTHYEEAPISKQQQEGNQLRESVYSLISEMECGELGVAQFRFKLASLGINTNIMLERLLKKHAIDGSVRFREFVKEVQPLLPIQTTDVVPDPSKPTSVASPLSPGGAKVNVFAPEEAAVERERAVPRLPLTPPPPKPVEEVNQRRSHGDIVSWQGHDSPVETPITHRGKVPGHSEATHGDIIGWSTPRTEAEVKIGTPARRNSQGYGQGDIIAWKKNMDPVVTRTVEYEVKPPFGTEYGEMRQHK